MNPGGQCMTPSDLPPVGLKRWNLRHKLLVVAAVRQGILTFAEACARYNLTLEVYLDWLRCFEAIAGSRDLRARPQVS